MSCCYILFQNNSYRFPSAFPTLTPEYVASELVDGMLRNKTKIVLPKTLTASLALEMQVSKKALTQLYVASRSFCILMFYVLVGFCQKKRVKCSTSTSKFRSMPNRQKPCSSDERKRTQSRRRNLNEKPSSVRMHQTVRQ